MRALELVGQKFGKLTVLKRVENNERNHACWLCQCDCGNTRIVSSQNLSHGSIKACEKCAALNSSVERSKRMFVDLKGRKFGKLTALTHVGQNKFGENLWLCRCDCGNEKTTSATMLLQGKTKSCGCLRKKVARERAKSQIKDLIGQRFGRLTVLKRDASKSGHGAHWVCKCDCGNIKIYRGNQLRKGLVISCGCWREERCKNGEVNKGEDLIGKRFGRLTVLKQAPNCTSYGSRQWICKCDCESVKVISTHALLSEETRSCGCLRCEGKNKEYVVNTGQDLIKF